MEPDIRICRVCFKPFLEGYPHRHDTPVRPDYDPMPAKPAGLDALVALIRREYLAELPVQLHVRYVPGNTAPIGVGQYTLQAAGYATVDVTDSGPLGSPSWSPLFHRYIGSITGMLGEQTMAEDDLRPFPWTRHLNALRRDCAGHHRTWYEHQSRPLCWILVRHVVLGGYSIEEAAGMEQVAPDVASRLLIGHRGQVCDHRGDCPSGAFDKWWAWVSNDLNGIEMHRRPSAA